VDRVTVDVHEDSAQVEVTIHWAGGGPSAHCLRRPVARYDQRSNVTALVARMDGLRRAGHSFAQIAEHVNRAGFYPPKRTDARCPWRQAAGPYGPTRTNWSASASCGPTNGSGPNPVTRRR
jgi:hypothetical protein